MSVLWKCNAAWNHDASELSWYRRCWSIWPLIKHEFISLLRSPLAAPYTSQIGFLPPKALWFMTWLHWPEQLVFIFVKSCGPLNETIDLKSVYWGFNLYLELKQVTLYNFTLHWCGTSYRPIRCILRITTKPAPSPQSNTHTQARTQAHAHTFFVLISPSIWFQWPLCVAINEFWTVRKGIYNPGTAARTVRYLVPLCSGLLPQHITT